MKELALALMLASADLDHLGTVESVREVLIADALQNVFEHAVRPQTADEVVIRIDSGAAVILREDGMRRFAPGQRVRLVASTTGPHVELD